MQRSGIGACFALVVRRLLGAARSAQQASRERNDGPQQIEHAAHCNPHKAERNQQNPDHRVEQQRQQRRRPVEHQQMHQSRNLVIPIASGSILPYAGLSRKVPLNLVVS